MCADEKKGKDKERNECDGKQGNNARNYEGEIKCVETRRDGRPSGETDKMREMKSADGKVKER